MSIVVLVAFEVDADDMKHAQLVLMQEVLPYRPPTAVTPSIECWWFAEDERIDGSDNGSAVFIPGIVGDGLTQREAYSLLNSADQIFKKG